MVMLGVLSKDLLAGRLVKWNVDGKMEEMRGRGFKLPVSLIVERDVP